MINDSPLKRYYQFHSKIYDATRWSFLFGRQKVIDLARNHSEPTTILEVGCGTGTNLTSLATAFPQATITGLDLSHDMLAIARNKLAKSSEKITLLEKSYDQPLKDENGQIQQFDLIVFSYALSMFNPGWEAALNAASEQLNDNGIIAVVDFQTSGFKAFRQWMQVNHVRMDNHLTPQLEHKFLPIINAPCNAYLGLWQYLLFIGKKKKLN